MSAPNPNKRGPNLVVRAIYLLPGILLVVIAIMVAVPDGHMITAEDVGYVSGLIAVVALIILSGDTPWLWMAVAGVGVAFLATAIAFIASGGEASQVIMAGLSGAGVAVAPLACGLLGIYLVLRGLQDFRWAPGLVPQEDGLDVDRERRLNRSTGLLFLAATVAAVLLQGPELTTFGLGEPADLPPQREVTRPTRDSAPQRPVADVGVVRSDSPALHSPGVNQDAEAERPPTARDAGPSLAETNRWMSEFFRIRGFRPHMESFGPLGDGCSVSWRENNEWFVIDLRRLSPDVRVRDALWMFEERIYKAVMETSDLEPAIKWFHLTEDGPPELATTVSSFGIMFRTREDAGRFAQALAHAITLCGGTVGYF